LIQKTIKLPLLDRSLPNPEARIIAPFGPQGFLVSTVRDR
jgi:hypothetical protein